jgi:hypothetical protein
MKKVATFEMKPPQLTDCKVFKREDMPTDKPVCFADFDGYTLKTALIFPDGELLYAYDVVFEINFNVKEEDEI